LRENTTVTNADPIADVMAQLQGYLGDLTDGTDQALDISPSPDPFP